MVIHVPRHRSLLWQLFAAEALVLVGALVVLVLAPIQVSTTVVVTEVLILSAGLAVMLAVHLLLLRRVLGPLRRLTDVVGTLDARDPGRLPTDARTAEVNALAEAFNGLLDRLDEEQRRSARRALLAQEDERARIAREMHDQVGQSLTALTIQAERGAHMDSPVDPALLERIAQTALQSLEDVRRIGRELRPEALDDLGLGNALIALCRRLSASSGVRVNPTIEPGVPELGPDVELVVYRIAQEAITNALRHAQASTIDVRLGPGGLSVRDDGIGLPATLPDDTAGISGMRERAGLVGAKLEIRRDRGTVVHLTLP
jgi:two-component system sensor histidine kinase UhpB